MQRAWLVVFLISIPFLYCYGQVSERDSLETILNEAASEDRIEAAIELARLYEWSDLDSNFYFSQRAIEIADEIQATNLKGRAMISRAVAYSNFDSLTLSYKWLDKAEEVLGEVSDNEKKLGLIYNVRALNLAQEGKLPESLKNHLTALRFRENAMDSIGIAGSLNNIGNVYQRKEEYDKAMEFYHRAAALNRKLDNQSWLLINIGNLGNSAYYTQQYDSAIYWHEKAFELANDIDDPAGCARSLLTLGNVFLDKEEYDEAESYYKRSLEFMDHPTVRPMRVYGVYAMGVLDMGQRNYRSAAEYLNKALDECEKMSYHDMIPDMLLRLSETYDSLGMVEKSYRHYQRYVALKDSMFSSDKAEEIVRLQMTYDFEREQMADSIRQAEEKEMLRLEREKEAELAAKEIEQRNTVIYLGGFALVILLAGGFYVFRQYRSKKRLSDLVILQKSEVEEQKLLLEEKHKEITDSINYAQRIQNAVIPDPDDIKGVFEDAFIYYQPKDIVSGDFYWFTKIGDVHVCVLADCTGHGVPGALMSIMGSSYLDAILRDANITDPAKALTMLDKKVTESLWSSNRQYRSNDGMDIAICAYHPQKKLMQFAGARRPLFVWRKEGKLEEIKPDKVSIGGSDEGAKHFTAHELKIEQDDRFYLFSDGIVDQFGGPRSKKLKLHGFREHLQGICAMRMEDQQVKLDEFFRNWKGDIEQIDDVCVIGVRV